MKPIKNKKVTLYISTKTYTKMRKLVSMHDKEIAWHGFVEKLDDTTYIWYDIILFPQYVTAATVMPEDDEYAAWIATQMGHDNFSDMRLHGHSHVNMACSPSVTDRDYRDKLTAQLADSDFYFFRITNKKDEYEIELYDKASGFIFDKNDINILIGDYQLHEETEAWAKKVIAINVKEKTLCSTPQKATTSSLQREPLKAKQPTSSDAELWGDSWERFWRE